MIFLTIWSKSLPVDLYQLIRTVGRKKKSDRLTSHLLCTSTISFLLHFKIRLDAYIVIGSVTSSKFIYISLVCVRTLKTSKFWVCDTFFLHVSQDEETYDSFLHYYIHDESMVQLISSNIGLLKKRRSISLF